MESFYKRWLRSNEKENKSLKNQGDQEVGDQEVDDLTSKSPQNPTDLAYENENFKLFIEKGYHKHQKNFRLEDHMFYFKILPKDLDRLPLLSDILDFLHAGFLHLLDTIKEFYNKNDNNIAYLTLFQEPMINGLNTGIQP